MANTRSARKRIKQNLKRRLRNRAVRIVCELAAVDADTAQHALEKGRWVVKNALKRLGLKI